MPWQETDAMEQRRIFVAQALDPTRRRNMTQLCKQYGVSPKTGYKWLQRYEQASSLTELRELSRRPKRSPRRTADDVEARVVELRERFPYGGVILERRLEELYQIQLDRRTIDRIIKRRGLIRPEKTRPPAVGRFERSQPNDLAQVDFKGEYPIQGGYCFPLVILDDHSRFLLGLFALLGTALEPVKRCFIRVFEEYGLPNEIVMDHGVPWWNNRNGWGLTRLSVWLIQLGITLIYGRVGHPQTRGKTERLNRTMDETLRHWGLPSDSVGYERALAQYRHHYNHERPHSALGYAVPASRYTPSGRVYRPEPAAWDYPAGADVRRLNPAGLVSWNGRRFFVCEALAGEWVWCQPFEDRVLVTFRHMHVREINLRTGRTTALVCKVGRRESKPSPSPSGAGAEA